ncbi:MAG: tetratricopeptide repeat protein [Candidatus Odinarchaeota archaeon]
MIFDGIKFNLSDLLKYKVLDKEGRTAGQINDIILSTDDLSISKLILNQDLYGFKSVFIETSDIVQADAIEHLFTISRDRSELEEAELQDFWDMPADKSVILFSKLKKLSIIDIDSQEHPEKVLDIHAEWLSGLGVSDIKIFILTGGYIFPSIYIRTISQTEVALTIPAENIYTIANIPEESYQSILIDPDREIDRMDLNNPDWSMVNKLIALGYIEHVEQLLNFWQSSNQLSEEYLPSLYYYLGKNNYEWGEVSESIGYFKKTIDLVNQEGFDDALLKGRACTQLGRALVSIGALNNAKDILDEAISILSSVEHSLYRGIALNWLGRVYWLLGKKEQALSLFQQALELSELFDSPKTTAYSLENIALINRDEGHLEKAVNMLQKAIMTLKGDYPSTTASIMKNLAITYFEMGMLGKSLEIHYDALVLREKLGNPVNIGDSIVNLARVETAMGSFNPSSPVLSYFPSGKQNNPILKSYRSIVEGLLAKAMKKWDIAITFFKDALSPNLDFNYQVWVYEYICESMLMRWRESPEQTLEELKDRLLKALELTKKNNLYSYSCKCGIILALLSIYSNNIEKAEFYFQEALKVSRERGLKVHEHICRTKLDDLPNIMEKIDSNDFEQMEFLKNKTVMEMLLYGRYLRVVHLF